MSLLSFVVSTRLVTDGVLGRTHLIECRDRAHAEEVLKALQYLSYSVEICVIMRTAQWRNAAIPIGAIEDTEEMLRQEPSVSLQIMRKPRKAVED